MKLWATSLQKIRRCRAQPPARFLISVLPKLPLYYFPGFNVVCANKGDDFHSGMFRRINIPFGPAEQAGIIKGGRCGRVLGGTVKRAQFGFQV